VRGVPEPSGTETWATSEVGWDPHDGWVVTVRVPVRGRIAAAVLLEESAFGTDDELIALAGRLGCDGVLEATRRKLAYLVDAWVDNIFQGAGSAAPRFAASVGRHALDG